MPLSMASVGEKHSILRIVGKDEVRRHLAELGFVVGSEVEVLSKIGGNMILSVRNSRVALDQTMASRIVI